MIKQIVTTNNKIIKIYDDVFPYVERTQFHDFIINSYYRLSHDTTFLEHKGDYNLSSAYSKDDLEKLGFLQSEGAKIFIDEINGWDILQIRVNLCVQSDPNRIHVDVDDTNKLCKTLIYYPNMIWEKEWNGFTIFTNDELNEIEYCSFYVPGRVIIFDGTIPHASCASSIISKSYRYTFVIQFTKNKIIGSNK